MIRPKLLPALLLAAAGGLAPEYGLSQDSETANQVWPELDTYIRLNDRMRIFVQLTGTRLGDQTYGDGNAGAYLDYYALPIVNLPFGQRKPDAARGKYFFFRAGYNYALQRGGNSDTPSTSTIVGEWTARLPLSAGLLLGDRNRFDLRFTGGDFRPRYRNRVRLERQFDIGKIGFDPYVYGEFFYDFDQGFWNRIDATAGVETQISRRFVVEFYYQRQHNFRSSPEFVNGFGLVFQLYLR